MAEAALDAVPSKSSSLAVPLKAVPPPVPEALSKASAVVPEALSKGAPVPVPEALSKGAPLPVPEALSKAGTLPVPPVAVLPPEVPSKASASVKAGGPPPAFPSLEPESGKPKGLVLGDETFQFAAGLQDSYPDMDFTACTVLSTQNITAREANPFPPVMKGRVRHMVNPLSIGKTFPVNSFDELIFFLPGLSFSVPKELGTADRPLFAYRVHHFVFQLLRSAKCLLKGEGQLHVVWPEETSLMSSPCGAAGIEMMQLLNHLGCKPEAAKYSMENIKAECIKPIIFGSFYNTELPEWLQSLQISSFQIDMKPISLPLSVALQLHPDLELVSIKGAVTVAGMEAPNETAPLRQKLIYEAIARKARLKEIFSRDPKETSNYDLVKEALAPDPDALLSIPMEAFMMTLEELPHFSLCLKFQVLEDQPNISHAQLDVLDPRLPTRVARPAPAPPPAAPALPPPPALPKKRSRPKEEEWGEMKFFCPLTKICTATPEKMREHMEGELYKQFVAKDSTWESSEEKRDLLFDLEEAEEAKRPKKSEKGDGGRDSRGKDGKGKGKGGKGKRDGKDKGKDRGKDRGGKDRGKKGGKSSGKNR